MTNIIMKKEECIRCHGTGDCDHKISTAVFKMILDSEMAKQKRINERVCDLKRIMRNAVEEHNGQKGLFDER